MDHPIVPLSKAWIAVYAEGDSEEFGDEPEYYTRRITPYAAQAAEAVQERFAFDQWASGHALGPR